MWLANMLSLDPQYFLNLCAKDLPNNQWQVAEHFF